MTAYVRKGTEATSGSPRTQADDDKSGEVGQNPHLGIWPVCEGKQKPAWLREVYFELRHRMHDLVPKQGAYLRSVVGGHFHYYAIPMNGPSLSAFRKEVGRLWCKVLRRRSHKHSLVWDRMKRLMNRWLPPARVCHPYPLVRFGVIT